MVEFIVTVPDGTGGGYYIDGVQKPVVPVVTNGTFRFNQNAYSNNNHPLAFSTTTSTAGRITTGVVFYLDGVTTSANYNNNSLFNAASVRYIEITVSQTDDFYYICNTHGAGMGNVMDVTYDTWGALAWNDGEWGSQPISVVVPVGGDDTWGRGYWGQGDWNSLVPDPELDLTIDAPVTQGWGLDSWGADTWGGLFPDSVIITGTAVVVPTGSTVQTQVGTLQFSGIANVTVSGNVLTLTIGNAVIVVDESVTEIPGGNLLNALVQSPTIIAGGSVTDAVVGEELDLTVGTVNFKVDQIITQTGSSVQVAVGEVIIELPSVFDAVGSSVVTSVGNALVSAGISVQITGNGVTIGVGTVSFSTQQKINVSGNLLTLGVNAPIVVAWAPIDPPTGQVWTLIQT